MGKVTFKNPDKPQQPTKGVYCWSDVVGRSDIPFYIGEAGKRRQGPASRPSTLARGPLTWPGPLSQVAANVHWLLVSSSGQQ